MVIYTAIAEIPRYDNGNRQLDPSDKSHLERVRNLQTLAEGAINVPKADLAIAAVQAVLQKSRR